MSKIILISIIPLLLVPIMVPPAVAAAPVVAEGAFTVQLTREPSFTPVDNKCLFEATVQLDFTGTLDGSASGPIRVLIFAPCTDVTENPPGTFADWFETDLTFTGTIAG
jgi:hypothetical protein